MWQFSLSHSALKHQYTHTVTLQAIGDMIKHVFWTCFFFLHKKMFVLKKSWSPKALCERRSLLISSSEERSVFLISYTPMDMSILVDKRQREFGISKVDPNLMPGHTIDSSIIRIFQKDSYLKNHFSCVDAFFYIKTFSSQKQHYTKLYWYFEMSIQAWDKIEHPDGISSSL